MNVSGPGASDAATTLPSVSTDSIDRELDGAVSQIADKIVATTGASAAAATAVTLDTVATAAAATTEAAVVSSSETSAAAAEAAAAAPAAAAASSAASASSGASDPSDATDASDSSDGADSTDASAFAGEQLADVSDVDQVEYASGPSAPALAAQQQISAAQAQKMAEHVVRRAVDHTVASGVAGSTYESNYASELMDQQQILSQVSAPLDAMQSSRTLLTEISTNHLETQSDVLHAYEQLHDEAQQMPAYLNSTASPLDDGHLSLIDHEVAMFRVDNADEALETPPLPPDRLG